MDAPFFERLTADKLFAKASACLDLKYLEMSKVDVHHYMQREMERLILTLDTYFHAIPEERVTVDEKYPRDWWQAFRERWFPQWWLNRHPVMYREIYINKVVKYGPVCPHLNQPGGHLEWLAQDKVKIDGQYGRNPYGHDSGGIDG